MFDDYDFTPYFQLSEQVQKPAPLHERLALCEQARPVLAGFVSACLQEDGELPPSIPFRDYAPIWYMRTGQWEAAASYINFCISCKAYFPGDGQAELQYLNCYQRTAQIALEYISQNPGCLQSQIHKLLSGSTDKECLKQFTKFSELIKKVPYDKTNRLYVAQQRPYGF